MPHLLESSARCDVLPRVNPTKNGGVRDGKWGNVKKGKWWKFVFCQINK